MGRAELRRQAKSRKKEQEKVNKVLKKCRFSGVPTSTGAVKDHKPFHAGSGKHYRH